MRTPVPSETLPGSAVPAQAYPRELALLVKQRWSEMAPSSSGDWAGTELESALPNPWGLEQLLSVCYQASLLHEENRPVTFRLALAKPESFAAVGGPPAGFHRLVFSGPRPFDQHELRRLAPAASFERSLIGVQCSVEHALSVWGLVHSGPDWLRAARGGRGIGQTVAPVLMVAVSGPGRVLVSKGTRTLAALAGGTLIDLATDVFAAPWLATVFENLYAAQWAEHTKWRKRASASRSSLAPAFGRRLHEHVLRRVVATIRGTRHGGTLIILPESGARQQVTNGSYFKLKYQFCDEEPRRRIFSLTIRIMNELTKLKPPGPEPGATVGWAEYQTVTGTNLAALDEALFEVAHFVAMLADVDGAVVLTDRLEVLGFGAEVSGALPEVESVNRSLNALGTECSGERTDRVGTRHRSSYRLCQQLHDALVIVVSQDGGVRFVRWQQGAVTYFDQIATGPWEV